MTTTLEVRHLTKRYRRVAVVNDVNFTIRSGEITGYLGPNGSGKSTTVKMLTGLVEPSQGEILLDGIDVRRDLIGFKRILGYVPEEAHVYPSLTGMEYLQLMGRLRELPERLVNDYLICVGTLVRLVRDDATRSALLHVQTPHEFIDALTATL